MAIPKEEFEDWISKARERFGEANAFPLIDEPTDRFGLLYDAFSHVADHDATRNYLESCLARAQDDKATRFVILNYHYNLWRFDSKLKEDDVFDLRRRFRSDLAFFVRLRAVEDCIGVDDISWEIPNACAVRDWPRAQELYLRLRSTGEIEPRRFHAAYGNFLVRAAFDDYDPEDPEDDSERLSQWSVSIIERTPRSDIEAAIFELSALRLGLAEDSDDLPAGRSEEHLRDAKNELEKARDILLGEFRPGLRSALARCYMARGEYRQAASEYRVLGDTLLAQMAWVGGDAGHLLRSKAWGRVGRALELAQDDSELRRFLENRISLEPNEFGPREQMAKLEATSGNYQSAFRYLSEANAINPAHDQDWKATLLVELGTRAQSEERVAEIVRRSFEKNPELRAALDGIVGHYWPAFRLLTPEAQDALRGATLLLFNSGFENWAWTSAATLAGKAVELQLRSTVFVPFADDARRKAVLTRATTPGDRPEPLAEFIKRGPASPLTLGAMVNHMKSMANPKEGLDGQLRTWLRVSRRKMFLSLSNGTLNAHFDIGEIRNRAAHASITQDEAATLYTACRKWLDELTRDQ